MLYIIDSMKYVCVCSMYVYIAQLVKYLSSYSRTIIFTDMSEAWGMCLPP